MNFDELDYVREFLQFFPDYRQRKWETVLYLQLLHYATLRCDIDTHHARTIRNQLLESVGEEWDELWLWDQSATSKILARMLSAYTYIVVGPQGMGLQDFMYRISECPYIPYPPKLWVELFTSQYFPQQEVLRALKSYIFFAPSRFRSQLIRLYIIQGGVWHWHAILDTNPNSYYLHLATTSIPFFLESGELPSSSTKSCPSRGILLPFFIYITLHYFPRPRQLLVHILPPQLDEMVFQELEDEIACWCEDEDPQQCTHFKEHYQWFLSQFTI